MGSTVSINRSGPGESAGLVTFLSKSLLGGTTERDPGDPPPFGTFISKSALSAAKCQIGVTLNDPKGRRAFEVYLCREFPNHFCKKGLIDSERDLDLGCGQLFRDVVSQYEKPDCTKHDLKIRGMNKRRFSFDNPQQEKSEMKHPVSPSEQRAVTANMMALKAWPTFLLSEEFKKWKTESGTLREENDIVTTEVDLVEDDGLTYLERLDREFEEIIAHQSWLVQLLQTVESLPLCVSIATARRGQRGFPLVYVNQFFETTTGYTREEILGQNCRFLQKGKKAGQTAEATSIARLSAALGEGRQVKVAITNFKKDGTPFMNLLALKPIFDSDGNYAFVVGIQFDIGEDYGAPGRLRMVESVLDSLPNTILAYKSKSDHLI